MKTLIVDDELVSRKKMHKIMMRFGECVVVDSGKDAISAFIKARESRVPFDLITLDVNMPEMDGTEVLYEIRNIEKEKGIPKEKQVKILMATFHSDKDTIITCIQAECDDYIVKPFDQQTLFEKIQKIQSGKRLDQAEIGVDDSSPPQIQSNKLKTLIVDDDIVSQKKMQKILEDFSHCVAVDSGKTAIAAFKHAVKRKCPFDLVTLDVNMPEMNGIEVLHEIRRIEKENKVPQEKQVKILMVTVQSDKDTITTCIQEECDDYAIKPCDKDTLLDKIDKIRSGKRLTLNGIKDIQSKAAETKSDVIEEIIACFRRGEITLPSPPLIYSKFKELIDKGAKVPEIAALLKQDVAVSFKLISVSNSTYYRGMSEIETMEQAINRLGLDTTRQYVEAISNRTFYDAVSKKFSDLTSRLWEHSLSCAYACQIVTEVLKINLSEDAFSMGLFHDIGKLVLLHIFGELEIKGQLGEEVSRIQMFNDLDTHHGKFGATLLKKWKFPAVHAQIAMYHNNLEGLDPAPESLLVVHFANTLVKSMGFDIKEQSEIDPEKAASAFLLKIDPALIIDIKSRLKERMAEMKGILQ